MVGRVVAVRVVEAMAAGQVEALEAMMGGARKAEMTEVVGRAGLMAVATVAVTAAGLAAAAMAAVVQGSAKAAAATAATVQGAAQGEALVAARVVPSAGAAERAMEVVDAAEVTAVVGHVEGVVGVVA